MKTFIALVMLTSLVGCGDDVAKGSRNQAGPERNTSQQTAETTLINSQMHREKGSTILTYADEIKKTFANEVSSKLYRFIPSMEKDDEGSSENVTTVEDIGRPTAVCGTGSGFTGINARISDCSKKNADKAFWDGKSYGAAGEGSWKLVMYNGTKEFWLDEKSGMVWSHVLAAVNWCKASGNTENNTTETVIDCNDIGDALSSCSGKVMDEVGDQIKWRLPTRNDFLQADINGARFVMKKENETTGLWTATLRAAANGRNEAWVYNSKEGTLTAALMTTERAVRCVGAPLR